MIYSIISPRVEVESKQRYAFRKGVKSEKSERQTKDLFSVRLKQENDNRCIHLTATWPESIEVCSDKVHVAMDAVLLYKPKGSSSTTLLNFAGLSSRRLPSGRTTLRKTSIASTGDSGQCKASDTSTPEL